MEAEAGRALEAAAGLDGVAGFGVALATDAELPGVRADREIAGQADAAIWEGEAGGEGVAKGMNWGGELASVAGWRGEGLIGEADIGFGLVQAFLAAEPLGGAALVIVAIAGEQIAKRAERNTVLVVAALETGERLVVAVHVQDADGAQSLQVIMDIA